MAPKPLPILLQLIAVTETEGGFIATSFVAAILHPILAAAALEKQIPYSFATQCFANSIKVAVTATPVLIVTYAMA